MDQATAWFDWLAAAGGALAVLFIVVLAAGIVALTLFYLGSAVVVLERFARARTRAGSLLVVWVGASLLAASAFVEWMPNAAATGYGWVHLMAIALVCVGIFIGITLLALRFLAPRTLGVVALALAGLGAGMIVGSSGSAAAPVACVVFAGLLWAVLAGWRGRLSSRPGDAGSSLSRALFFALLLGSLLGGASWLGSGADGPAASGGSALLQVILGLVVFGVLPLAAAGFADLRHTVEWFIAVRYLLARRKQVFISAITAICVIGIAAGVWLIIVVLSVMNGFQQTWRDEILGNRSHFTLHSRFGPFADYDEVLEQVRATPGVVGASAFLEAEGMVRGQDGGVFSVRVRGIEPQNVSSVSDLGDDMVLGSIDGLAGREASQEPGILLGSHLAVSLGVGLGDSLLLISPFGGPQTPLGPAPRLKRFEVAGIFQSTFFQHDEVYTYVTLEAAQDFRRAENVVDGIDARTTDFYRSRVVAGSVIERLSGPYYTRDWKEYFPAFFQALKSERVMMFLLLTMIMVVAAFVIVATLIMMIMEKSSDIAILKAMGAEDSAIERIFAIEGTLIGLAGTAIGVLAGIAVTDQLGWIQDRIEAITGIDTLPASVYQLSTLPSEVDPLQVATVVAIAMVLSLGATLLPSRQGAKLDPAEALRHE